MRKFLAFVVVFTIFFGFQNSPCLGTEKAPITYHSVSNSVITASKSDNGSKDNRFVKSTPQERREKTPEEKRKTIIIIIVAILVNIPIFYLHGKVNARNKARYSRK